MAKQQLVGNWIITNPDNDWSHKIYSDGSTITSGSFCGVCTANCCCENTICNLELPPFPLINFFKVHPSNNGDSLVLENKCSTTRCCYHTTELWERDTKADKADRKKEEKRLATLRKIEEMKK